MSSSDELSDALDRIYRMVKSSGGDVESQVEDEIVEGKKVSGYSCTYEGKFYNVYGASEDDYLEIVYKNGVFNDLYYTSSEPSEEDVRTRLEELIDSFDSREKEEVNNRLSQILMTPGFNFNIKVWDGLAHQFTLSTKVFPYRTGFDIVEFHDVVSPLTVTGERGMNVLREEYGIMDRIAEDE